MKTLVIYTSTTGFTEKYAQWLTERLGADLMKVNEAMKKSDSYFDKYDALIYGGWALAGSIQKSKWFLERLERWQGKRLALFCVGASPAENEEVDVAMDNILTAEQKNVAQVFYCPGGLSYERMPFTYRLAMRAFAALMKRKHPDDEKVRILSSSYDVSDPKYLDPLVEYITAKEA